jgi:SAM-dependent methyltransferase
MLRLPEGYQRQNPVAFDDFTGNDGRVWQPDVYPAAADLARSLGVGRIIDLGCGSGTKLEALACDFDVIGVDTAETIRRCRVERSTGTWVAHDLDADVDLPDLPGDAVVVCSDVIEHLWHPERLLARLVAGGWPAVLSTPDRVRTHGPGHMGPPPNPAHAQEWTLGELLAWIGDLGGVVESAGFTRSFDGASDEQTILVTIGGAA